MAETPHNSSDKCEALYCSTLLWLALVQKWSRLCPGFADFRDAAHAGADFGLSSVDLFLFWRRSVFLNISNRQLQTTEVVLSICSSLSQ